MKPKPVIAVFWWIENLTFGYCSYIEDLSTDPDIRLVKREDGVTILEMQETHPNIWSKAKNYYCRDLCDNRFIHLFDQEWAVFPRGEILYNTKNETYYVVCSKEITQNFKARNLIKKAFNLPEDVSFYSRAKYNLES